MDPNRCRGRSTSDRPGRQERARREARRREPAPGRGVDHDTGTVLGRLRSPPRATRSLACVTLSFVIVCRRARTVLSSNASSRTRSPTRRPNTGSTRCGRTCPARGILGGQLTDERVDHFPRRCACDRYAAARRNTSFSCSSNRIRRLASRNSPGSLKAAAAFLPSCRSATAIQFVRHDSEIPKSAAICFNVVPSQSLPR